ncbi:MAG TPA: SAM-dependent methyltransferase, partial [Gemmatimonadota bacterium]|nr:SAM-dependent methyltransferase [Gemmatimonadota bacterium]
MISLALLGFGASGSFLALARGLVAGRERSGYAWAVLLAVLSFDPAWRLAAAIPFDAFELLAVPRQVVWLSATYLVLAVPFFLVGLAVALAFLEEPRGIARVYAANLAGSGAGVALGLALLSTLPAGRLPLAVAGVGSLALAPLHRRLRAAPLVALALALLMPESPVPMSAYKEGSMALRQPEARLLHRQDGPLGRLDLVAAPALRYLPGASLALERPVPPRPVLYRDGQPVGPISAPADTALYAMTPAAAAFALPGRPAGRVAVVGLGGGGIVRLAHARGAESITVVDADGRIDPLLPPGVLGPHVRRERLAPRGWLRSTAGGYDRILLAEPGSLAGEATGMAAAGEGYLFTVEAVTDMWRALSPDGVLAVTRWVLDPPRDLLRLTATVRAALDAEGEPAADHVALVRGWGTATLLVSRSPLTPRDVADLRAWSAARGFDLAWAPGVTAEEANRYNVLEPDRFRIGLEGVLGPRPERFFERYPFRIEPVRDDAPFFFHFLPADRMLRLWREGGRMSLPYFEWGLVAQALALVQAVPIAAILILLPLVGVRRRRAGPPPGGPAAGWLFGYFALLGLAFMLLEISAIQRLVLLLASPILATTVVVGTFLVFAGAGSLAAPRVAGRFGGRAPFLAIAALAPLAYGGELLAWSLAAGAPLGARAAIAVGLLAPVALAMGMPFPLGLQRVADRRPDRVPWCWGVNGFLSVIGAVAAPLLALEIGFGGVLFAAVGLYLAAGAT